MSLQVAAQALQLFGTVTNISVHVTIVMLHFASRETSSFKSYVHPFLSHKQIDELQSKD